MSERDDNSPPSAPPTPEAHGNREENSPERARNAAQEEAATDEAADERPDEVAGQTEVGDPSRVRAVVEALLFASDEPLAENAITEALPDVDADQVNQAIENLRLEYSGTHRGIHLAEVAGGFQLRTNPDFKDHVLDLYESRPRKLSRAAMETLAIIAYQQPLTRAEVEEIRGVDCSGVIRTLGEHDLVETIGRLDDLGRPHIYGTTERFLEFFGLESLEDLPSLDESDLEDLEEMYAEELAEAEELAVEEDAQASPSDDQSTGGEPPDNQPEGGSEAPGADERSEPAQNPEKTPE
ncbi:MAG: SMC-Scp complex subunit ScpB [Persicimonas sp.]